MTRDKAHTIGGYFRYSVTIRIYKDGHWGTAGSLGQVTHHDRSNSKA